ncbi:hypothetical protein [Flagellimonas marina]|uniref:Uncharacterized protein n=1 Tax=Flagellimonas marina TaxID=1775168 RepID=A0ABV8PK81_9FLAO
MWFKIISYLKFLLKSTNEHGVHSPFVFNFVTKCLYSKKKLHSNKSIDVLLKSIGYFNCENIQINTFPEIETLVGNTFENISFDVTLLDMLYTDSMSASDFLELLTKEKLHNDSMILINGIHQDRQKKQAWESLVALPNITVSIDMFHCGALFVRREQVKEHFTIRI